MALSASPTDCPPVDAPPPDSPASEADAPSASEASSPSPPEASSASGTDASSAPPPTAHDRPTVCLYCGTDRSGPYCHECGQKYRDTPLTLRELLTRVFRVVTDVDSGLLYTLRVAFRNPGAVARRYVDGETRRFLNPISYLLVAATLLYVVMGLFKAQSVTFLLEQIRNPVLVPSSSEAPLFDPENPFVQWLGATTEREYAAALFERQRQYLTLMNSFSVIPITLGTWLFFRKQSTLAETAVLGIYVVAQTALFNMIITPLAASLNSMAVLMSAGTLVSLSLHLWAATAFFERSARTVVFALLGYVTGILAAALLGGLVGSIVFWIW